jgi:hypothetical protein
MDLFELIDLSQGTGRRLLDATISMGFSEPVARAGLNAEFEAWKQPGAIESVMTELVGVPSEAIPKRILIIAARTLPVSLMRQALFARLMGAQVVVKPATGTEVLAQILSDADSAIEPALFPSQASLRLQQTIDGVDTVVALGSDDTIDAISQSVPFHKTFVGYGHKASMAWLKNPSNSHLEALAEDICAWDQAGCLSPQMVFCEEDPDAVLPALADALRKVERHFPMELPKEAAHPRIIARTLGDLIGQTASTTTALLVSLPQHTFRPSPGYRMLWLVRGDRNELKRLGPLLSTVGTDCQPEDFADLEGVRICSLGHMQKPPLTWPHDGRPNLKVMLRAS